MDSQKAERRNRLETTGNELSPDNIDTLKFLFHGLLPAGKLQECTKGSRLLLEICIDGNDEHLVEGLARAGRKDLASKYSEGCQNDGEDLYSRIMENFNDLEKTCLNEFRVLLLYIANELTDSEDLQKLKDVTTRVPTRVLAKADTVLDFFSLLMEEKHLQPQTLQTSLLKPMECLGITAWKKHSGKISGFEKRVALPEAGGREGSRVKPKPTADTILKVVDTEQTSEDITECLEEAQETELKSAEDEQTGDQTEETVPKVNAVEVKPTCEPAESSEKVQETAPSAAETGHTREKTHENIQEVGEQGVERTEHPKFSGENEERSDVSQEEAAETEYSNTGRQKQENQDQIADNRQNGAVSEHIEEGRNQTLNPDAASGAKPKHQQEKRRMKCVRPKEYKMNSKPRGKAVIFNIEKFSSPCSNPTDQKLEDRTGSSVDADGLQRIFDQLHFEVERFNDCLFHELNSRLLNLARDTNHSDFDCIALFILTHGKNGKLLDANCEEFDLEPLRKYFYASNCASLAGKPKMFFIQACQGSVPQGRYNHLEKDIIVVEPSMLSSTPSSTPSSSPSSSPSSTPSSSPQERFTESNRKQSPDEADFLLCYSSPPGYVSYRHRETGSWFISTFIKTLERDYNRVDLLEILTRANHILGDKTGTLEGKPCAQIANITTSLRMKVFFRTLPDT